MTSRDLILPSLFGDALSLGPHWIYNPGKIQRLYPEGVHHYDDPKTDYHPGKSAGDLTHYGDQAVALLSSLAHHREAWDVDHWRRDWADWARHTTAYKDGATTRSLENIDAGLTEASDSNDLAGASRFVGLFARFEGDELIQAARAQTALTHGDPQVIDAAEFFARAALALTDGAEFAEAFEEAAAHPYESLPAIDWLNTGRTAAEGDLDQEAGKLGLTCHIPEAFPLTLAIALSYQSDPAAGLSRNAMLGGDSAARGIMLGLLFGARHGLGAFPSEWVDQLNARPEVDALLTLLGQGAEPRRERVNFDNPLGDALDAVIDFPAGPVRAFALFAHCFTCGKNLQAASRIARSLAEKGIATLRFDFTGLGASDGDFAETSFLTNLDDLVAAADFMRETYRAPEILIGHSLGGAAVLAAASRIPESQGVVTIGAPADPEHVTKLLGDDLETIRERGNAVVTLAGRRFTIGSRFLDDFSEHCQPCEIAKLGKDLLIFHAPGDQTVGIDNAGIIYSAAKHPKSFHSLAQADHLLTRPADAEHVAGVLAAWAGRLV